MHRSKLFKLLIAFLALTMFATACGGSDDDSSSSSDSSSASEATESSSESSASEAAEEAEETEEAPAEEEEEAEAPIVQDQEEQEIYVLEINEVEHKKPEAETSEIKFGNDQRKDLFAGPQRLRFQDGRRRDHAVPIIPNPHQEVE